MSDLQLSGLQKSAPHKSGSRYNTLNYFIFSCMLHELLVHTNFNRVRAEAYAISLRDHLIDIVIISLKILLKI